MLQTTKFCLAKREEPIGDLDAVMFNSSPQDGKHLSRRYASLKVFLLYNIVRLFLHKCVRGQKSHLQSF